jgi:hypothetical protein
MEILGNDYESQDIIYILFSIFYYRQKIYKDFDEKENDGINGNKEISSGSSEKKQVGILWLKLLQAPFQTLLNLFIYNSNSYL